MEDIMEFSCALEGKKLRKNYKKFVLDIPELRVPKGYATALVGENGAGKTTLLDILVGLQLKHEGEVTYFGKYDEKDRENGPEVKEKIGYTGTQGYYLPHWKLNQIGQISKVLFETFDEEKYMYFRKELAIGSEDGIENKKVSQLSDGNRTKLMLAGVLARETEMLVLDEPASPLDPVMREKLCSLLCDYLNEKEGERTVLFSTHNIADMERITDYVIIMAKGKILAQGFVEELKEKYRVIRGEKKDVEQIKPWLLTMTENSYGFEGLCEVDKTDHIEPFEVAEEIPDLSKLCVELMKSVSEVAKEDVHE